MSAVRQRATSVGSSVLLDYLLTVTYRGDLQYLRQPDSGQFAVLNVGRAEKAFFKVPRGACPIELRALIESHFGVPAERVAEFLWIV